MDIKNQFDRASNSGFTVTDLDQCNCSRQSILYVLNCLEPNSTFEVEILETILRGAEHCRFQITKN